MSKTTLYLKARKDGVIVTCYDADTGCHAETKLNRGDSIAYIVTYEEDALDVYKKEEV